MKYTLGLGLSLLILTLSGCQSLQPSLSNRNIPLAKPIDISYKDELLVSRLTDILYQAELTKEQKAQVYYERGVRYDALGLRTLAKLDFGKALSLYPQLVEAYNFMGMYYTLEESFIRAYDAFDAVIDLNKEHEFAYLNRGVALYYDGRASLAVDDFKTFWSHQPTDPYRAIWLYLGEHKKDPQKALNHLRTNYQEVAKEQWGHYIILALMGDISEQALLESASVNAKDNTEYAMRLCEAYFYLAKKYQFEGKGFQAEHFFKMTIAMNVHEFVEYKYAKLELKRMNRALAQ